MKQGNITEIRNLITKSMSVILRSPCCYYQQQSGSQFSNRKTKKIYFKLMGEEDGCRPSLCALCNRRRKENSVCCCNALFNNVTGLLPNKLIPYPSDSCNIQQTGTSFQWNNLPETPVLEGSVLCHLP